MPLLLTETDDDTGTGDDNEGLTQTIDDEEI